MTKKLTDFLTILSTDKELQKKFKKDKTGTMRAHGVQEDHIDLVVNNEHGKIRKILNAEYNSDVDHVFKGFKVK